MTFTTQGIVLTYAKHRDFDRIYTVYTKHFGKLRLLARGANKIKSKLAGHLEPVCLAQMMIAHGRGFEVLAQARASHAFRDIRQNPHKLHAALIFLQALDVLTHTHVEETYLFHLLFSALERIEKSINASVFTFTHLVYHYLLHLLVCLGYAPDIHDKRDLYQLLVADIKQDDILVTPVAQAMIQGYLRKALDEKSLYSLENFNTKVKMHNDTLFHQNPYFRSRVGARETRSRSK